MSNLLPMMLLADALPRSIRLGETIWPSWLLALLLLALGGILGSFLNVVAYRLPRGQSLSFPGSRCPACQHAIRWYDNIPVFGWLMLRGRCRDCGARISPRYPLVEGCVAVVFVLLGFVELVQISMVESDTIVNSQPAVLLARLALHLGLFLVLLAAALIHFDGQRIPTRLVVVALVLVIVVTSIWPDAFYTHTSNARDRMSPVLGLCTALLMSALAWPAIPFRRVGDRLTVAGLLAIVGVTLGWEAVGAVIAASIWMQFILGTIGSTRTSWLSWLPAATIPWLVFAPAINQRWPADLRWVIVPGIAVAVGTLLHRYTVRTPTAIAS